MADYNELSDGRPDGARLGQAATDKVGLFGATPITQPIAFLTTVGAASLSTANVANLTTAQLSALCTNVDALAVGLRQLGIIADS